MELSLATRTHGEHTVLAAGDIVTFPFGTEHALSVGSGDRLIAPMKDLPPQPWRTLPMLRYGTEPPNVRILCGNLQCDAINFGPFRDALPKLLRIRTQGSEHNAWLHAIIRQMTSEADESALQRRVVDGSRARHHGLDGELLQISPVPGLPVPRAPPARPW